MTNATTAAPVAVEAPELNLDVFVALGREGGHGADSIIKAAMYAVALVANKTATIDDAESMYMAYKTGFDGETLMEDTIGKGGQIAVQISCFKTFLLENVVKNAEIHGRAIQLRLKVPADQRAASMYNSLVAVNRAQKKKGPVALTNAEIVAALSKKAPVEKDEIEKLEDLLKAVTAANAKFNDMNEAVASVQRRIDLARARILKAAGLSADIPEQILIKQDKVEEVDA